MARTIDLEEVQELRAQGAQIVEVLPAEEYDELHLPGAINLPLKQLDAERASQLDRGRPVIVYCWDALCDMSPRAAAQLVMLGYDAYDYALSKVDWMAHGLPMEGTAAGEPTAMSLARDDVATCTARERAEAVAARIEASPYGFALVLAERVVLGRVRASRLAQMPGDALIESLSEPGPSTVRPHLALAELAERFSGGEISTVIVTTPAGVLLGVVRRADLQRR